jgi:hypothetical protein
LLQHALIPEQQKRVVFSWYLHQYTIDAAIRIQLLHSLHDSLCSVDDDDE